jgi:putative inorganic carbon (HCO3(-)) transporter
MLRTLLVLLIAVPGLCAGVWNPFAALTLYVWYAIFRPEQWIYEDISSLRLSFVIGALLVLRCAMDGTLPAFKHPLAGWALLFFGSTLLSQLQPVDSALGWASLIDLGKLIVVALLIVSLVSNVNRLVVIVSVLAGSLGIHAAKAGLFSLIRGGVRLTEGLAGSFSDNNGYALGVVLVLPLLAAAGQNMPRRWLRWSFYVAVLLSAFTVVSLHSRGGFLALVVGGAVFVILQRRRLRAVSAAVIAVWLAMSVAPFPAGYFERIGTISQGSEAFGDAAEAPDKSAAGRVHFWRVAVLMARDRPFGVGLGNYEAAYDAYDTSAGMFGSRRAVHSVFFQVLAETGFLGAFTYIALLLHTAFIALRVRRRALSDNYSPRVKRLLFTIANGIAASMAGFVVGGLFLSAALNDVTWFTIGLVAALDQLSLRLCLAPEGATRRIDRSELARGLAL